MKIRFEAPLDSKEAGRMIFGPLIKYIETLKPNASAVRKKDMDYVHTMADILDNYRKANGLLSPQSELLLKRDKLIETEKYENQTRH